MSLKALDNNESFDKENQEPQLKVKSSRRRKIGAKAPKILRVTLVIVLISIVLILFGASGLFDLDEVEVTDSNRNDLSYVEMKKVRDLVESQYIGKNFFLSDPNEIKQEIVLTDPYIDSLWIEKIAPRKLHLFIVEKEPEMYILFEDTCIVVGVNNDYITENPIVGTLEGDEGGELSEDIVEVDCVVEAEKEGALFVNFQEDHYEFIIKNQQFFLYDQIQHVRNLLDSYGIEVSSIVVGDRLLKLETKDGKAVLLDPFEEYDIQLKRIVLILNQIKWSDQDFLELDVRYDRPVLRREFTQ